MPSLVVQVATRVGRWLSRRGFGAEEPIAEEEEDEPLLAAAVAGRAALGERAGRRTRRVRQVAARPFRLPPLCGEHSGYNMHAAVWVAEDDRAGLQLLTAAKEGPRGGGEVIHLGGGSVVTAIRGSRR